MKPASKKALMVAATATVGVAFGLALRPYTASGADPVDGAIEDALALPDEAARERALLAVVAPGAEPAANSAQVSRVLAALDGAPERVKLSSIEIEGPLPLAAARAAFAGQIPRFRACQLFAREAGGAAAGGYTLRLRVAADGQIAAPATVHGGVDGDGVLSDCFSRAAAHLAFAPSTGPETDADTRSSGVTLEIRVLD